MSEIATGTDIMAEENADKRHQIVGLLETAYWTRCALGVAPRQGASCPPTRPPRNMTTNVVTRREPSAGVTVRL